MLRCEHGGNLDKAISQFGGNRKEWIDLSTGMYKGREILKKKSKENN